MNKGQRVIAGVILILMGVISFIFVVSVLNINIGNYYFRMNMFRLYPMILLGIVFIGGGIFVLISKRSG